MMTNQRNQLDLIDILNFIIIFLQIKTQIKLDRQATNNDLLQELQKDTDSIIERLDRIEGEKKK